MNATMLPREEVCNHQKERKQKRIVSGIHRVSWKWPAASLLKCQGKGAVIRPKLNSRLEGEKGEGISGWEEKWFTLPVLSNTSACWKALVGRERCLQPEVKPVPAQLFLTGNLFCAEQFPYGIIFYLKMNSHWSIVALQYCVSFYCTAKWISHTYAHILSFFGFPSRLGHHRALSRFPCDIQ